MGKIGKRVGAWMGRAGRTGERDGGSGGLELFEDLWPLYFVPETRRRPPQAAALSADLPSPEAEVR